MDVKFRIRKSMIVPALLSEVQYAFKRIRSGWRRWDTLAKSESELFQYFVEDVEDMFVKVTSWEVTKCGDYTSYYIRYIRNGTGKVAVFSFDEFSPRDLENLARLKRLTRMEPVNMD